MLMEITFYGSLQTCFYGIMKSVLEKKVDLSYIIVSRKKIRQSDNY